ncbi:hypothetical protein [Acidocella facilis]|uniref:hypothetical protein n=1 Tax=Acidocella facilis TaxID=525 RepID=UPI001F3F3B49|nr:hypothetical protein [Acidocella facilis]
MLVYEIVGWRDAMPAPVARYERETPSGFSELDRVKLRKAISVEGRDFAPGLQGTVVLLHGHKACEVEFDTIQDTFGIPTEYLEKI